MILESFCDFDNFPADLEAVDIEDGELPAPKVDHKLLFLDKVSGTLEVNGRPESACTLFFHSPGTNDRESLQFVWRYTEDGTAVVEMWQLNILAHGNGGSLATDSSGLGSTNGTDETE